MNFRACPGPDGSPAPATMLMNRKLRTRLPRLKQETLHLKKSVLEKQQKQKQYYDVKTKSLRPLAEGSTVRIQRGKSWNSMAQVMKKADTPRSYILQDETGRLLRRNRRDLLRTDESFIGKGPQDLGDNEVEVMEPATSDTQSTAIVQEPITCSSIPEPTTCSSIPSTCSSIFLLRTRSPRIKQDLVEMLDHLPGYRITNIKLVKLLEKSIYKKILGYEQFINSI